MEGEVGKDQRQVEPEPLTQVPRRVKIAIEIGFEHGASMTYLGGSPPSCIGMLMMAHPDLTMREPEVCPIWPGKPVPCPWKGSPCTVFAHWQTRATKALFLLLSYNIAML